MRDYNELLDVVNEQDEVIGQVPRNEIHKKGLLHREVQIWVYNDKREILFQRRAPDKDTSPNKLDASAGGHVDMGMDYDEAALKELEEETGIKANPNELVYLKKEHRIGNDKVTGTINNVLRKVYLYKISNEQKLVVEEGKATSLEYWTQGALKNLTNEERKEFLSGPLENALLLEI